MNEARPGHGPDRNDERGNESGEVEFSIAKSNALVPLLLLFALTVVLIVYAIVTAAPIEPPEGAAADKAFSPINFPALFGKDEALVGLDVGGGKGPELVFPVPAPPFSEGIYPCSDCHEGIPPNPERRPLEGMHSDIKFDHDAEHRWCLDCHDVNDRDQLRLASGVLVPFTESYRLCGQCHGTQYRDWRIGIHGKRTGYWQGSKRYLLCVHCHNPHSPKFRALAPLPPPIRPQYLRSQDAAARAGAGRARGEVAHGG